MYLSLINNLGGGGTAERIRPIINETAGGSLQEVVTTTPICDGLAEDVYG